MAREGMVRAEDLPSAHNFLETKKSLGLALKADVKKSMDIISKTMIDLLSGLEDIFTDPMNLDEAESRSMDLVLGGKAILKFFMSLSDSNDGLLKLVEDLRVWECTAPTVKKDKLNALIVALKNLKEPVLATTVINIMQTGMPTKLDSLIDHLSDSLTKELGSLSVITVAPWNAVAARSSIEISSGSLSQMVPVATSSAAGEVGTPRSDQSTRATLDRLKEKFQEATSALNR